MTCSLYIILCSDGSLYTGVSRDPWARFKRHQQGRGAFYTRLRTPQELLAVVPYGDRQTAVSCERALKSVSADKKWYWIAAATGGIAAPDLKGFPEPLRKIPMGADTRPGAMGASKQS